MTRRSALLAAAVAPLSACALTGTRGSTAAGTADTDRLLRGNAAAAERAMLARYQLTTEAHPELAEPLAAFVARHERHLSEILATAPPDDDTDTGDGVAADVPAGRQDAVAALREAESAHAADRTEDSIVSADYGLARVLASIAACESAHQQLLGDLA